MDILSVVMEVREVAVLIITQRAAQETLGVIPQ
jgi:hypothetical protein